MVDCATIRDLLPLYVDGILSQESKALISGHLATCEDCKAELDKMQSELVKLPSNDGGKFDGGKFDVLRTIKKKLFRQKVLVALGACAVTLALVFGAIYGVFHHSKPIEPLEYTNGFVNVMATPLDITLLFDRDFYSSNSTSRIIDIDGTKTEVTFIYISGTLFTRWWPRDRGAYAIRFGYSEDNAPLPVEIYYLIAPFGDWFGMSDEDFYEQRHNGAMIWSGVVEVP
ncbi:MAG: zf-HC2 domain-containing protein [Defluviitaleaceae bacterium]|nr:zf-HC2 domain-containing protein [Defluviitaleaceae bacterium]